MAAASRLGRPERLDLPLETLPAVGADAREEAARSSGSQTVGDLLFRRPRRYEPAADEVAISQLWGDEEVAISGVVERVRAAAAAAAADDPDRDASATTTGSISANWFNQPWLADKLLPGHRGAAARPAVAPRVRGSGRTTSARRARPPTSRRSTARASRCRRRGSASSCARRSRCTRTTCSIRCPPSSSCPIRRDALCGASTSRSIRSRPRTHGGGSRSTSSSRSSSPCCARASRARRASRCRRPGELVARYRGGAAVRADRAPGARDRRDRPRPRARRADAAAAAGRRRLGEDGRSRSTRCCARSRRAARAR